MGGPVAQRAGRQHAARLSLVRVSLRLVTLLRLADPVALQATRRPGRRRSSCGRWSAAAMACRRGCRARPFCALPAALLHLVELVALQATRPSRWR